MLFCFRSSFAVEYTLILVSSKVVLFPPLVIIHEATVAGSLARYRTSRRLKHTIFPNTIMILC